MVMKMKRINLNVAICKEYDEKTQSAKSFIDKVNLESMKAKLTIFIMINGINDDSDSFKYDFFIKCIKADNSQYTDNVSYLFTMDGKRNEGTPSANMINGGCGDFYQVITTIDKVTSFPCGGIFQIEVYSVSSECKNINRAVERYRHYRENEGMPNAVYRFVVKE